MFPKWQPISTAPKDGTNILIFESDEGTVRISRWRDDKTIKDADSLETIQDMLEAFQSAVK